MVPCIVITVLSMDGHRIATVRVSRGSAAEEDSTSISEDTTSEDAENAIDDGNPEDSDEVSEVNAEQSATPDDSHTPEDNIENIATPNNGKLPPANDLPASTSRQDDIAKQAKGGRK